MEKQDKWEYQRDAKYYDEAYKSSREYNAPAEESPYFKLWVQVKKYINIIEPVIELGCGVGQFAEWLKAPIYVGYDFSQSAISKCLEKGLNCQVKDVHEGEYTGQVVILETLEHLDDIKVLSNINGNVIITVPEFDDRAHLRYFPTMADVVGRYEQFMTLDTVRKIDRWYLITGTCNGSNNRT